MTSALLLLAGSWAAWRGTLGRPSPSPRPAPAGAIGRIVPELVGIEAGLEVDGEVPSGWSHRIIRSTMRLDSGDLDTLPGFARRTAERFRTILLARIGPDGEGQALHRIGVGLAMEHQGRELIVDGESLGRLGIALSFFDKVVLGRAEAAVARGRLAARTSTFALYDASLELAGPDGSQRSAFLRYALVVDPATGALQAAVWPIAEAPEDREAPGEIVLLPPDVEFLSRIQVAAIRAPGGLAVAWNFALTNLPPGRRVPLPASLGDWSIRDAADARESALLEARVRQALLEASAQTTPSIAPAGGEIKSHR